MTFFSFFILPKLSSFEFICCGLFSQSTLFTALCRHFHTWRWEFCRFITML